VQIEDENHDVEEDDDIGKDGLIENRDEEDEE
jgi:hypothetical protein